MRVRQQIRSGASLALLLQIIGLAVLVCHVNSSSSSHGHGDLSFEFTLLNSTSLPKPLSDLTATLYGETVYLAGGCDAVNGNVYDDTIKTFVCSSASDSLYAFSYRTLKVKELASMPVKRYRHAAVAVNGMLWLVGGRDTEADAIIGQVDVRRPACDDLCYGEAPRCDTPREVAVIIALVHWTRQCALLPTDCASSVLTSF
jgi:Kelch motif